MIAAVRAAWPQERPLAVRLSASDWVGEAGVTPAEAVEIARRLKAVGVDLIDVSAGETAPEARPVYGRMFQTPFADRIRNEAGIATMAVGNITDSDQVNSILTAGRADLVAIGRPHLADPAWTGECDESPPLFGQPGEQSPQVLLPADGIRVRRRKLPRPCVRRGGSDR